MYITQPTGRLEDATYLISSQWKPDRWRSRKEISHPLIKDKDLTFLKLIVGEWGSRRGSQSGTLQSTKAQIEHV